MIKRALDVCVVLAGLVLLAPLLFLIALLIKLDSRGSALFRQTRMGRGFCPFAIYKFRTMAETPAPPGLPITVGEDPRITRIGRLLRRLKLDELPQLLNVLRGEMSLVGPRPELERYVEMFRRDYAEILSVRPGITDLASLKYRDEAASLAQAPDPETEYLRRVLPDKIRLAKEYVRTRSLGLDLRIFFRTLRLLFPGA